LLWTEENVKNADEETIFLLLDESSEKEKYNMRLFFVDKNKKRIKNSTMLVFYKHQNGLLYALKNNCIDPNLPLHADFRGELVIDSETDKESFDYLQESNQRKHSMKDFVNKIFSDADDKSIKH